MKGLTIGVQANSSIPKEFLLKATTAFSTYSGLSWRDVEEKRFYCGHYGPADVEAITDFRTANMKVPVLVFLGNHEGDLHDDDKQPFVLFEKTVGKEKFPQLVACVEGDFSNFAKAGSAHTPEFFVRNELINLMNERYLELNGDIGKLLDEMKNPMINKQLKNMPAGRGSIVMMSEHGRVAAFSKEGTAFKWGWVSDALGYAESEMASVQSPTGVHTTTATPAKFGSKPTATVAPEPEKEVHTPVMNMDGPVANPKTIPTAKTDTAIPDDTVEISPPDGNQQSNKRFYRLYYPDSQYDLPKGWQDGVAIRVKKSEVRPEHIRLIKSLSAGSVLLSKREDKPKQEVVAKSLGDLPKDKVVTTTKAEEAMIVSDMEAENSLKIVTSPPFQKFVIAGGELLKNPEEWAKAEAKYPSWSERTGLSIKGDLISWPPEALDLYIKAFPKLAKLLIIELRSELVKTWGTAPVTKAEPTVVKAETKTEKPAEVKKETPKAVEAAPPDEEGYQQVMAM